MPVSLEEVRYEAYGPAGVAEHVDAMNDNQEPTAPRCARRWERRRKMA